MLEKRILPRFALQIPISLVLPDPGLKVSGTTRDVSAGGIFFYADAHVEVQQEIELVMTLPQEVTSGEVKVSCRAKILRVEADSTSGRIGFAAAIQKFDFLTNNPSSPEF